MCTHCENTDGCEKLVWLGEVNRTCIAYRDSPNKHNILPGAIQMAITRVCYILVILRSRIPSFIVLKVKVDFYSDHKSKRCDTSNHTALLNYNLDKNFSMFN